MIKTKTTENEARVNNRKGSYAKKHSNAKSSFSVKDFDLTNYYYDGFGAGEGELYYGGCYYYVA